MTTNNNIESKKKATNAMDTVMGWLSEPLITGPVILTLIVTVATAAFTVSRLKEYSDAGQDIIKLQQEALAQMGWPLNDETQKVMASSEQPKQPKKVN
ncbi:TPA: hypothetical protein I8525_004670 [Aeromonas hydrophila]|nr:hypothetical protein [Aeromonas hydrophila]